MLESFTVGTFGGHLGDTFRARPDASSALDFGLISATELGEKTGRGRPFSIVFRGPRDALLSQRTYRMEHAEISAFDIFFVPIGPDERGFCYEAVFK